MKARMSIKKFNAFTGPVDGIDHIEITFPMEYDFEDVSLRRSMNETWQTSRQLPERFAEANSFIEKIKAICPIINFARTMSIEGTFLTLLIGQEASKKKGVIESLKKLIG